MGTNADQIQFWNGQAGEKWARLQDRTDLMLNNITDALMPFACVREGERVLDIGCGCGSTTFRLAMSAGKTGSAVGIDISTPMLAVAQARAQAMLSDVQFVESDASSHDFQPVFDLVFSRFGVMFFDDPVSAFTNIRRALAPKGRLAFVCWRAFKENDWSFVPFAAAWSFLPEQPPTDPYAPGPFAFAEAERTKSIIEKAGFRNVEIKKLDTTSNMGATVEEAADGALNIGPLSRAANDLPETVRAKIHDAVREALVKFKTPPGITPGAACWLVGGTA